MKPNAGEEWGGEGRGLSGLGGGMDNMTFQVL